nr:MAG TPA: hypothetical protein [Crassvirales sp.]
MCSNHTIYFKFYTKKDIIYPYDFLSVLLFNYLLQ